LAVSLTGPEERAPPLSRRRCAAAGAPALGLRAGMMGLS
jgi:hypothetical protein